MPLARVASPLLCTLFALTLVACGGDDGPAEPVAGTPPAPAPGPAPAPPTGPAPTPAPVTVTGQYRLEPSANTPDAALAALNALGQQGHVFVSPVAGNATTLPVPTGDLYLSDSAHAASRLVYTMATPAASMATHLALLNQHGAAGRLYKGDLVYTGAGGFAQRSLFVQDTSRTATYTYEAKTTPLPSRKADWLAELNAQGARGFRFLQTASVNSEAANLYVKVSAPAATYSYAFVDSPGPFGPADGAALKTLLNTRGAGKAAYLGASAVDNTSTFVMVFETSSLQTAALTYDVVPVDPADTLAQTTAKANAKAAAGEFLFSDVVTADGRISTVYVKGAVSLRHPFTGPVFP